jgi:hypothetical protein
MDSVELAACPNDANLSLRTSSGCMKEIIYQNTKNGFEGMSLDPSIDENANESIGEPS